MADIERRGTSEIVLKDDKLKRQHHMILLSEAVNQLKQLELSLERMKTVDMKKIELKRDTLIKEIEYMKQEMKSIDVTMSNKGGKDNG